VSSMSVPSHPKASFRNRLDNGDFLSLTVWAGKADPTAEVVTVQIRRLNGDVWETVGRLAAYRTADGNYSQLPERTTQKPQDESCTPKELKKEIDHHQSKTCAVRETPRRAIRGFLAPFFVSCCGGIFRCVSTAVFVWR